MCLNLTKPFLIAGIDEAGRGPLAGPVTAAAVVLPKAYLNHELRDSKKITPKKRELLYSEIVNSALAYTIVSIGARRIDKLNILQATKLAMLLCAQKLSQHLRDVNLYFLVDGNHFFLPEQATSYLGEPIIKGDDQIAAISAASILAKVTRDRLMSKFAERYPAYEFEKHKGYGTALHCQRIEEFGPCTIHRQSFIRAIVSRKQGAWGTRREGGRALSTAPRL
ncbi:ribonuclease HII [bacterium]|nr:ribonuclease HII [bacterium]